MISSARNMFAAAVLTTLTLTAGLTSAQEAKVPETATDHEALAKNYKDKADGYRKDAEWHKQMAEAYAKSHPDAKGGQKNAWNAKMQKHCAALAKSAEKLATDSEKAAEFHTLRAKETQGK